MTDEKLKIIQKYIEYVCEKKNFPFRNDFLDYLGAEELNFKNNFTSMPYLQEKIWLFFLSQTLTELDDSQEYRDYSARNKMLAFYFTFFEKISGYRDYFKFCFKNTNILTKYPNSFKVFKPEFKEYAKTLLTEGKTTGELADRKFLNSGFEKLFWTNFISVLHFWFKDTSEDLQKTDALIEKSIHFTFDLASPLPIDSAVSLVKFLIKH